MIHLRVPGVFAKASGAILEQSRSRRVQYMLLTVVLLSLADLYLTVMFLREGGFPEANPVARAVMAANSVGLLVAWKLATVAVTVSILYAIRKTRSAELGAIVCCCVLGWLTFQWLEYVQEEPIGNGLLAEYGYLDPHWVSLTSVE
ncbi:MAG: hypothetical protein KF757_04705 [Phycisphaeraceae bacterium]|nr:hypothetical protein [Phycisphaeraceae bacterium]MCW5764250.1 hypothetical protein [Phycisphaeraceae bacterium]